MLELRRVRLACELLIIAALAGACSSSNSDQSGARYEAYRFTCCVASDVQTVLQPGQTFAVHWIVESAGQTADSVRHPIVLNVLLRGPYPDVISLKGGATPKETITAVSIRTDDRSPQAPTSTLALPADLATGFYNLHFDIDFGGGNSASGASVVQVASK